MKLDSLDEILRFAIRKEADAAAFYKMAADRSTPGVKKTFEELAEMEEGHKKKLEAFDPKEIGRIKLEGTKGLGISEMMEDVPFSSDMSYADLLRMAIKNEEKAERLYTSMASVVKDAQVKQVLEILAREEIGHKKRLEKIYEDDILTEM